MRVAPNESQEKLELSFPTALPLGGGDGKSRVFDGLSDEEGEGPMEDDVEGTPFGQTEDGEAALRVEGEGDGATTPAAGGGGGGGGGGDRWRRIGRGGRGDVKSSSLIQNCRYLFLVLLLLVFFHLFLLPPSPYGF